MARHTCSDWLQLKTRYILTVPYQNPTHKEFICIFVLFLCIPRQINLIHKISNSTVYFVILRANWEYCTEYFRILLSCNNSFKLRNPGITTYSSHDKLLIQNQCMCVVKLFLTILFFSLPLILKTSWGIWATSLLPKERLQST